MKIRQLLLSVCLVACASVSNAALIEIFQDGSSISSLAAADALIAGGAPVVTDHTSIINYNDHGDGNGQHHFTPDNPWPAGFALDHFAARITGTFGATPGVIGDFRLSHDDGMRMTINGSVIEFPGATDDHDSFLTGLVLNALNTVEIIFFEQGGGASLELSARCASCDENGDSPYFLLGLGDPVSVPEPGMLTLLALGLLGVGLRRRPRRA